ncbi:MAG: S8 family serine peptidase [Eubacteriales bacterium]
MNRPEKQNSGPGGRPGTSVPAETQGKPTQTTITNYYVTMSGSFMATPMVTGTAALLLQQNPSWIPNEVKRQMMNTDVNLGFAPNEQGVGEIV